ncbi:hypothetical protein HG537_0E05970 [Torulaspora globosa]|uniref:Zn(2)-C6 fungal-type domain-containing protein n=1 Tax=Torulaspora globosa TaxID=48254 RepID=A0A7H9HV45_9SACH|nr:hypothetical protein HG537_0E05970 [Torulaspora sp. CBS 2947]
MLSKSRNSCEHCLEKKMKCGRERPTCGNCTDLGINCKYRMVLYWGGRPNKKVDKKTKIHEGLSVVNGVFVIKRCEKSSQRRRRKYNEQSSEVTLPKQTKFSPEVELNSSMEFVRSSEHYSSLWLHFTENTSQILVATIEANKGEHPFRVTIPNLAKRSLTLTKLLIAFGARHRYQLYQQPKDYETSQLMLGEAGKELVKIIESLPDMDQETGELTLACILMLAGYCIFFGDNKMRWTIHLGAARYILSSILGHTTPSNGQKSVVVTYCADPSPRFFLIRWFAFMTVLGLLSSSPLANTEPLVFDFSGLNQRCRTAKCKLDFESFEYNAGLRTTTLEMLMKTGKLIMAHESQSCYAKQTNMLFGEAIELDYEIMRYFDSSESENRILASAKGDELLLATDLLFGLSGMLHLRRRIMNLPSSSKMVKDLVLRAARVLLDKVPSSGTALCSITSCIFVFGCECGPGSGLEPLQPLFSSRLEQIELLGMPATSPARSVMHECWEKGSCWWEIYKERNIELSFGT